MVPRLINFREFQKYNDADCFLNFNELLSCLLSANNKINNHISWEGKIIINLKGGRKGV